MEAIQITNILYLISAVAFILGIKRLSHPKTARSGNLLSSVGMLIAIIATLTYPGKEFDFTLILAGVGIGGVIGILFGRLEIPTELRITRTSLKLGSISDFFDTTSGLQTLQIKRSLLTE